MADVSPVQSLSCTYFLARHAAERADQLAIIDGPSGESIRYGDLLPRIARMAGWLSAQGIAHGDRVACLALNSKAYTEFYLALAWLGAVMVPLNIRHSAQELSYIIGNAGAKALFACPAMRPLADSALADNTLAGTTGVTLKILSGEAHAGWISFAELIDPANPPLPRSDTVTGESLFMLLYTSGTTGKPKGCMIPQRSWTGYAVHMASCFQMGADDVYLAFLPYFHVAGFGTALSQLILGGTIVTAPTADLPRFYRLIEQHRVSVLFMVPGLSTAFVHDPARTTTDTSSLKTFISGAGVEKLELIEAVESLLGARYFGIYGQTEAGGKVTWVDGPMLRADPGSYGHVMPFFDYRLRDEHDADVAPGGIGELCLRGSSVMQGYWNDPVATAETLKNDWHHTGDLFVRLANGQLKMVDRKKYLIKTGGENVYPQEVEQVLLRHPAVSEAAVIGIADAQWGEAVKALLVLKPGQSPARDELADWVGSHIAGYKKPRYIEFIDTLPRNASGKILKNELVARITTSEQKTVTPQ